MGKAMLRFRQKVKAYNELRKSRRIVNLGKGVLGHCCDTCTINLICYDKCDYRCEVCNFYFCANWTGRPSKIDYKMLLEFMSAVVSCLYNSKTKCVKVSTEDVEFEFSCSESLVRKTLAKVFSHSKFVEKYGNIKITQNNGHIYFILKE